MLRERGGVVIGILLVIILILGGIVLYTFAVKPSISGYTTKIYNQGANDAITILINQIQARGYAEIPLNSGQSLILIPAQPSTQTEGATETSEESAG